MIRPVPRVAMKGFTFNLVTIKPLTRPIVVPMAKTTAIAMGTLDGSPCIIKEDITAVRLMVKATERSIEAPINTKVCPTATMPRATDRMTIFKKIVGFFRILPLANT